MIGRSILVGILTTAAVSAQAAAQAAPDAKMWNGAWHLNAAKSKFGAAGKEQSETRTYDFSGGKLTMKSTSSRGGKNLHFGIREHDMAAIMNGLSLSKLRPFGATFFIFTDYARPAIRISIRFVYTSEFVQSLAEGADRATRTNPRNDRVNSPLPTT